MFLPATSTGLCSATQAARNWAASRCLWWTYEPSDH